MAEEKKATDDQGGAERKLVEARLAESPRLSTGSVAVADDTVLKYRVSCEYLPVARYEFGERRGEPQAAVFTAAYELDDHEPCHRPVCFAFNGGPGSASIWLHLGALGPKRVVVPDDGSVAAPPFAIADNALTWLKHFDLVFIDPPHTGWSIAAGDEARKQLLSVDGDVAAMAEVVRVWLTRHRRWSSKLYLVGESYGTTRGAAMADALANVGVGLSGLILVSTAIDLQTILFAPKNDLPYATFLPAMAAAAQYHGKLKGRLAADPKTARNEAAAFVQEDYVKALFAGVRLSSAGRKRISRRLAELTGLSTAVVEESNLRIDNMTFFFELLRDRGLQVGRLDSRSTSPMGARRGRTFEFDPGVVAVASSFSMAAATYLRESLGVSEELRYDVLSMDTYTAWNWNRGKAQGNGFCTTSDDLARAMRRNPHLRVLVASGHYDLGTPFSAIDWSLAQMDLTAEGMARIEHHYYDAGHMFYTRQADLEKLERDLSGWLAAAE